VDNVVAVLVVFLSGCGLLLDAAPGEDSGALLDASTDGEMDADRPDTRDDDVGVPDVGRADALDGGPPDGPRVDSAPADTGPPVRDTSLDAIGSDAVIPLCGPDPYAIITLPPLGAGLLTYTYDADTNGTGFESWTLLAGPAGMTLDGSTGVLQWESPTVGMHDVRLSVADRCMRFVPQVWSLNISRGLGNGLAPQAVTRSALAEPDTMRALSSASITESVRLTEVATTLDDPRSMSLLMTLARCALPRGEGLMVQAQGRAHQLVGESGLAPEWSFGPCDASCRQAVSACTLASVNPEGARVQLFFSGESPLIHEGGFFGDLFADPPVAGACRGSASPESLGSRTCTLGDPRCPVTMSGPCDGPFVLDVWLSAE
jgi:hypothetical protein